MNIRNASRLVSFIFASLFLCLQAISTMANPTIQIYNDDDGNPIFIKYNNDATGDTYYYSIMKGYTTSTYAFVANSDKITFTESLQDDGTIKEKIEYNDMRIILIVRDGNICTEDLGQATLTMYQNNNLTYQKDLDFNALTPDDETFLSELSQNMKNIPLWNLFQTFGDFLAQVDKAYPEIHIFSFTPKGFADFYGMIQWIETEPYYAETLAEVQNKMCTGNVVSYKFQPKEGILLACNDMNSLRLSSFMKLRGRRIFVSACWYDCYSSYCNSNTTAGEIIACLIAIHSGNAIGIIGVCGYLVGHCGAPALGCFIGCHY